MRAPHSRRAHKRRTCGPEEVQVLLRRELHQRAVGQHHLQPAQLQGRRSQGEPDVAKLAATCNQLECRGPLCWWQSRRRMRPICGPPPTLVLLALRVLPTCADSVP